MTFYRISSVELGQGSTREGNAVRGPIIGGPFTLIDTEHRIVTEKDIKGEWVLLYFGYTSSPDVGPEQLNTMAKAIDTLGLALVPTYLWHQLSYWGCHWHFVYCYKQESKQNAEILPVFVTIDPQRDTPSHLRAYLKGQVPLILPLLCFQTWFAAKRLQFFKGLQSSIRE